MQTNSGTQQKTLSPEEATLKDLVTILANLNQQILKLETTVEESQKFTHIVQITSFVSTALQKQIEASEELQNEPSGIKNIEDSNTLKEEMTNVEVSGDNLKDLKTPF